MYFTLMGKLSARRQNLAEDKDKGFTLIELLVVVIIIGILAAIAIPVYLGVTNNAKDSAVKSDLTNFKTAIISLQTNTGALNGNVTVGSTAANATQPSSALLNAGASKSADTYQIIYNINDAKDHFCVQGLSSTGKTFTTTDTAGIKENATCSAGVSS